MLFPNKFAGTCRICAEPVAARAGFVEKRDGAWTVLCADSGRCKPKPPTSPAAPAAARTAVGDLSGILALFGKARQHLKFPAISLVVRMADEAELAIRVNVAGAQARVPGSLTVVDSERDEATGRRDWLGRIHLDGTFEVSRSGRAYMPALLDRLQAFAADPAKIAGEDGRLHGRCCFCRIALSDERSTFVGYGRICASRYGLPWGEVEAPVEPSAPAVNLFNGATDPERDAVGQMMGRNL
jgi:hypothetical protein